MLKTNSKIKTACPFTFGTFCFCMVKFRKFVGVYQLRDWHLALKAGALFPLIDLIFELGSEVLLRNYFLSKI